MRARGTSEVAFAYEVALGARCLATASGASGVEGLQPDFGDQRGVPEPPRESPGAPAEVPPTFCDYCGARVQSGFPLCPACFERVRAGRPQTRPARRGWLAGIALLLVCCLGTAVVASIVQQRRQAERRHQAARQEAERRKAVDDWLAHNEARLRAEAEANERAEEERRAAIAAEEASRSAEEARRLQPAQDPWPSLALPTQDSGPWLPAGGNLWSGVRLYYGPTRWFVGTALGGNDHYADPYTGMSFRGVKVAMAGGSVEWKDRDAIALGDWHVRRDDPALAAQQWEVLAW